MKEIFEGILTEKYYDVVRLKVSYRHYTKKGYHQLQTDILTNPFATKEDYTAWLRRWKVVYAEVVRLIKKTKQIPNTIWNEYLILSSIGSWIANDTTVKTYYATDIRNAGYTMEEYLKRRAELKDYFASIGTSDSRHSYYLWILRNEAKKYYKEIVERELVSTERAVRNWEHYKESQTA